MRVVMVSELLGDVYGQEKVVAESARLLQDAGHEVFFIGAKRVSELPRSGAELLREGLFGVHTLTPRRTIRAHEAAIVEFSEKVRPDIIHFVDQMDYRLMRVLSRRYPSLLTAHTLAPSCPASHRLILGNGICDQRSGWKCVWHHHSFGCLSYLKNDLRRLHAVHNYLLKRRVIEQCPKVIAISHFVKRVLVADGWSSDQILVVPNPVSVPKNVLPDPLAPKSLLVTASRLVALKGIDRLLQALKLIERLGWNLWIIGSGPEEPNLRGLLLKLGLGQRVRLLGQLPHAETLRVMASATAYVQANVGPEGFGMSVAEASALAKPVIAFDVPAINELIQNEKNGLLAKPDYVESLAGCLRIVLENQAYALELGRHGALLMRERFSPESHLQKTLEAYKTCLR